MYRVVFSFIFSIILHTSVQKSTPQDGTYVAAVVEYEVQNASVADDVRLQRYVDLIQEAAQKNADIMIFPEMTLTTTHRSVSVPIYGKLKDNPIPALEPGSYDEILVRISAAARQYEMYVIINIQEEMDCSVDAPGEYCPEPKKYFFNTNVVFDRQGAVIDRYRKINLFGEYTRTPALRPDLGIFSTDFGVTFGHFICFDLMFQIPAVQVVEKFNITDVIFSTMWFSEMPYLTATQIQEAYAYTMDVNFLASGANNVKVGSAGSGIFSGKAGALVSIMPGAPTTRLLVSRVPKVPGQVDGLTYEGPIYDDPKVQDGLVLIKDPSLKSHVNRLLSPGYNEFTLVDKDVSCRFRVRLSNGSNETVRYRAFVKDGINTYARRDIGVVSCAVIACKDEHLLSCPHRYKNEESVAIPQLEIEMSTYRNQINSTLKCDNIVYFPSSFTNDKFPIEPANFTYVDSREQTLNGREFIKYTTNNPQMGLVSFGIWGRIYTKDVNHNLVITEDDIRRSIEIENDIYAGTSED